MYLLGLDCRLICRSSLQNCKIWGRCHLLRTRLFMCTKKSEIPAYESVVRKKNIKKSEFAVPVWRSLRAWHLESQLQLSFQLCGPWEKCVLIDLLSVCLFSHQRVLTRRDNIRRLQRDCWKVARKRLGAWRKAAKGVWKAGPRWRRLLVKRRAR